MRLILVNYETKVIVSNRIYLLLLWCVFIISSFLVVTISLYEFKDNPSVNLVLNFYESVFNTTAVFSILYMFIMWLIAGLESYSFQNLSNCVLISFLWFFQVFLEFGNRVAVWSAFSLFELVKVSFSYSFNVILMVLVFYVAILKLIQACIKE